MKKILITLLFAVSLQCSYAQLFVGAAYGTFNNPGSGDNFRGTGPTLMVEYVSDDRVSYYLNASLYKKNTEGYSEGVYDDDTYIGDEKYSEIYNYKYLQLGFKGALIGDFSDSRVNWFVGAGGMLGFVSQRNKYEFLGNSATSDKFNYIISGFSFNTGIQCRIKRVVIETRGCFDLSLKPVVASTGGGYLGAYAFTALRAGVLVPLTKY